MKYGSHVYGCFESDSALLKDYDFVEKAMLTALKEHNLPVLNHVGHKFDTEGEGVTFVVLLATSHASIHTWPEDGYATFDVYTCGNTDPLGVAKSLFVLFGSLKTEYTHVVR